MKKVLKGSPNPLLKAERELRGWSQKYAADQIGADRYYLSRWEHGTASPSPFYRQKLCALFGKNARELGLLQDNVQESKLDTARVEPHQDTRIPRDSGPIYDPTVPALLPGGKGLV